VGEKYFKRDEFMSTNCDFLKIRNEKSHERRIYWCFLNSGEEFLLSNVLFV